MSTHRHWLAKPICQLKMSLVNQIFSIGTSNTSVTFISMSSTDWKGEPKWSGHRSIQWGKNVCMGHTPNTFHQSESYIQTGSDWSCLLSLQLWCTTVRVTRVCDLLFVKIYIVLLDKTKTIISTKVLNASKVCLLKIIWWQKKDCCSWQKRLWKLYHARNLQKVPDCQSPKQLQPVRTSRGRTTTLLDPQSTA